MPKIYTFNNCPCIIFVTVFYMYVSLFSTKDTHRASSARFKYKGELKSAKHLTF
jgi:hypothetical protein